MRAWVGGPETGHEIRYQGIHVDLIRVNTDEPVVRDVDVADGLTVVEHRRVVRVDAHDVRGQPARSGRTSISMMGAEYSLPSPSRSTLSKTSGVPAGMPFIRSATMSAGTTAPLAPISTTGGISRTRGQVFVYHDVQGERQALEHTAGRRMYLDPRVVASRRARRVHQR